MINAYAAYSGVQLVASYETGASGSTLQDGVALTSLAGAANAEQRWTFQVPAGATNLRFAMSGGTGDADLYVRFGAAPTTAAYDYRPYLDGNNESVSANPTAGTWHVMVRGYTSYSGLSLVASFD
jgi:hypothetical protein